MDEAAGCYAIPERDFFFSASFLMFLLLISGGCISNLRCELKNKTAMQRVRALEFSFWKTLWSEMSPRCQSLVMKSVEEKSPGCGQKFKSLVWPLPWVMGTCHGGSAAAWLFSWHCWALRVGAVLGEPSQGLFWVKKPFPGGLLGDSATPWSWHVKLFGSSASGLMWFFMYRKNSFWRLVINLKVALGRQGNMT